MIKINKTKKYIGVKTFRKKRESDQAHQEANSDKGRRPVLAGNISGVKRALVGNAGKDVGRKKAMEDEEDFLAGGEIVEEENEGNEEGFRDKYYKELKDEMKKDEKRLKENGQAVY